MPRQVPAALRLSCALTLVNLLLISCAGTEPPTPAPSPVTTQPGTSPQGTDLPRPAAVDGARSSEVEDLVERLQATRSQPPGPADTAEAEVFVRDLFQALVSGNGDVTAHALDEADVREYYRDSFANILGPHVRDKASIVVDEFHGLISGQQPHLQRVSVEPAVLDDPQRSSSSMFAIPTVLVPQAIVNFEVAGVQHMLAVQTIIRTERGWRFVQLQLR